MNFAMSVPRTVIDAPRVTTYIPTRRLNEALCVDSESLVAIVATARGVATVYRTARSSGLGSFTVESTRRKSMRYVADKQRTPSDCASRNESGR